MSLLPQGVVIVARKCGIIYDNRSLLCVCIIFLHLDLLINRNINIIFYYSQSTLIHTEWNESYVYKYAAYICLHN